MTKNQIYIQDNSKLRLTTLPVEHNLQRTLPAGTYRFIAQETMSGLDVYFEQENAFKLPDELYGSLLKTANHIVKYRTNNKGNLGILLHGVSGTGKSLLAKYLCESFVQKGYPIIIVDANYIQHLPLCVQQLKQPSVILLDEFEKMYKDNEEQSELLTILDGVYQTDHTFILTANDTYKINHYMFSRPSRIRYSIAYSTLAPELVEEILTAKLEDKTKIDTVLSLLMQVDTLSFDVLFQFINEVNQFPESTPEELINMFNVDNSEEEIRGIYDVSLYQNGKPLENVLHLAFEQLGYKVNKFSFRMSDLEMHQLISTKHERTNYWFGSFDVEGANGSNSMSLRFNKLNHIKFGKNIEGEFVPLTTDYDLENMSREALNALDRDFRRNDEHLDLIKKTLKTILASPVQFKFTKQTLRSRFVF